MSDATRPADISIAEQAQRELWQQIRSQTRRRLARSASIGLLYLLASLAVGAYLLMAVGEISSDTFYLDGWELKPVRLEWMMQLVWGYAGFAVLIVLAYIALLLLVFDKLPAIGCSILRGVPCVGSTTRVISLGEFCEAVYRSVIQSQPYHVAFDRAVNAIGNADLSQWSARAARQVQAGFSVPTVLRTAPIRDLPLSAVIALISHDLSAEQTTRVWQQATEECHQLARSRVTRTAQLISITCVLLSVMLACMALFVSATLTRVVLQNWTFLWF